MKNAPMGRKNLPPSIAAVAEYFAGEMLVSPKALIAKKPLTEIIMNTVENNKLSLGTKSTGQFIVKMSSNAIYELIIARQATGSGSGLLYAAERAAFEIARDFAGPVGIRAVKSRTVDRSVCGFTYEPGEGTFPLYFTSLPAEEKKYCYRLYITLDGKDLPLLSTHFAGMCCIIAGKGLQGVEAKMQSPVKADTRRDNIVFYIPHTVVKATGDIIAEYIEGLERSSGLRIGSESRMRFCIKSKIPGASWGFETGPADAKAYEEFTGDEGASFSQFISFMLAGFTFQKIADRASGAAASFLAETGNAIARRVAELSNDASSALNFYNIQLAKKDDAEIQL